MTFEELEEKVFDMQGRGIKEVDFHRHSNGGGWVENTARVEESVYVGPNACVLGYAQVLENASLDGQACVLDDAEVFGNAKVLDNTIVYESARIFGNAEVSKLSSIGGNAKIFGYAKIGYMHLESGEWKNTSLQYSTAGDRLRISQSDKGYSSVLVNDTVWTCSHKSWMGKEGEKLLKDAGFSDSEVSECRKYVWKIIVEEKKNQLIAEARRNIRNVTQKVTQKLGMRMG